MKGKSISPKPIQEKAHSLIHARKSGGRLENTCEQEAKELREGDEPERKAGGKIKKRVGKVDGEDAKCHGGRAARKRGGGVEASPFSSAKGPEPAPVRSAAI